MASEEPLFDPSLKKRKKKAVAFTEDPLGADADPTTPAPETIDNTTTNGEAVDLGPTTAHEQMKLNGDDKKEDDEFKTMFGDLKKKKKKKEIPLDLGDDSGTSTPTATPAAVADDLDFSDIKKKKKSSKKKAAFDLEAFEKELNVSKTKSTNADEDEEEGEVDPAQLDDLEDGDLGDDPFAQHETSAGGETGEAAWLGSDRDYTYPELLTRFYSLLHAANPSLLSTSSTKRYTIAPPSIHREGNKKSIFANVTDICKKMHRQPEHVIQFLFSEMGTTGSVDGAGRLVIKGRFQQKQVENVLRRYIVEYVTCKTCKSPDTLLTKENRIFFMSCESCGSRRSVNAIKSGFQAQVGKRSKNKTG
ncbi:eukaryotic translation initiation factor 2 beta [Guyanagaster necrorhizus]|uniref:Eukaryotic translation initiation factor 2 beta n=1 Tax=Guyanagaster necrorhizus TaxID=856835 RepID=A0A9P7W3V8_9AGAR|nr:eukaryotic translation initiation factor 2 beta [Guyanagaster necrorhizus MCA 3950]KAG7451634.1 eukaryotic translation initiation factor 2 beta [Guyanagaster necrorhizus MCA 3950]